MGGLRESSITKSEMISYLKENLQIRMEEDRGYYGSSLIVKILLDGEEISYDSYSLPQHECDCTRTY